MAPTRQPYPEHPNYFVSDYRAARLRPGVLIRNGTIYVYGNPVREVQNIHSMGAKSSAEINCHRHSLSPLLFY